MIIDTHAHCYWDSLAPRIDGVMANMREAGVVRAVQIGCDVRTSMHAIDLAERYPDTFSATI